MIKKAILVAGIGAALALGSGVAGADTGGFVPNHPNEMCPDFDKGCTMTPEQVEEWENQNHEGGTR